MRTVSSPPGQLAKFVNNMKSMCLNILYTGHHTQDILMQMHLINDSR